MNVIVDYGLGNLRSVFKKFERLGIEAVVSGRPEDIARADRLILPGVGSFDAGMRNLRELGLREPLERRVLGDGVPILGICLGMQLFTRSSEEGTEPGLGWLDAWTRRLRVPEGDSVLRVPHVGWNTLEIRRASPLLDGVLPGSRFYFVHSFAVFCDDQALAVAETEHGQVFASVVGRGNIHGVQFHPEKSHRQGLAVLRNFVESQA